MTQAPPDQVQQRRGRPPVLSRTQILDEAAKHNFGDLAMNGLAESLGVTPAALYRYFPSKADLATALVEHVASSVFVPPRGAGPWQHWVVEAAKALRTFVRVDRVASGVVHDDVALYPLAEAIAEVLKDAGLSPQDSWDLYTSLAAIALGAGVFEANAAHSGGLKEPNVSRQLRDRDVKQSSALGQMMLSAETFDVDEWFIRQVTLAIAAHEPARATTRAQKSSR